MPRPWTLDPDRCFSQNTSVRERARELYAHVADLPLVCPHGHVPASLLADPAARFGNPAELLIVPDHYVFRMLYSQGVRMEDLGIAARDGTAVETDGRAIWRRFCAHFHLFQGTPTGLWLKTELVELFGVDEKPSEESADRLYDLIDAKLHEEAFRPRALFRRFGIDTLATTDAASSDLQEHESLQAEGFPVRPTLRPDAVLHIGRQDWRADLALLEKAVGRSIESAQELITAIEERRAYFAERGATATDHAADTPHVERLSRAELEVMFVRALRGSCHPTDDARFHGHMLLEMARMSRQDGLTMQVHVGSLRNHHERIFERFGADMGADIPVAVDWTRGLRPLLQEHGHDASLRLVLFTLDESTYARELAPMAGHYPALRLGAPWWFYDSVLGMERYLDRMVETAGIYNLAGFNDDTRAFPSIPARHDVWRRTCANWLAGMATRGLVDDDDAPAMAHWLAYGSAVAAYGLA